MALEISLGKKNQKFKDQEVFIVPVEKFTVQLYCSLDSTRYNNTNMAHGSAASGRSGGKKSAVVHYG